MAHQVFRHTLLCEGSTDANLIPILNWVLMEKGNLPLVQGQRAHPNRLPKKASGLASQISATINYFGGDLLFIHRDADRAPFKQRCEEVRREVDVARSQGFSKPAVAVVPVRMMEAWLLFDETAIRKASGNPNGTIRLDLPSLNRIESRPNPKLDLKQALEKASELAGRALKKFRASEALWRIADNITDFSPLRELPSFVQFEDAVVSLRKNKWQSDFYC